MAVNFKNIAEKVMRVIQGNGLQPKLFSSQNGKSVAVPTEARYFYTDEPNLMVFIDDDTGEIKLESGFDFEVIQKLIKKGHRIGFGGYFGGYQAIMYDAENNLYYGASESRKDGQAAGY